jgi:hypothetical protein
LMLRCEGRARNLYGVYDGLFKGGEIHFEVL